jgi:hypothetical protein
MTNVTDSLQEEFNEQVQSVYRRSKGRLEAERELISQGDALLGQIDALMESPQEFQVYIGLAFHRRLPHHLLLRRQSRSQKQVARGLSKPACRTAL